MITITLKYPEGEFTQTELAKFNGLDKAAVYIPMREAIATGVIVKTGTRPTGKRPANLYRFVGSNAPVTVPAPQTPQPIVVEAPPVVLAPQPVPVPVVEITSPPVVNRAPNPAFPCPLCKGPMTEIPDDTGVMVKCYNEPCDTHCHENPFGHGRNAKDAYETAGQKFRL